MPTPSARALQQPESHVPYNVCMGMKERLVRFRSFWMFPLFSVILLILSYRDGAYGIYGFAGNIAIGLVFWTLLEYFFHRFLLHAEIRNATLRAFLNATHISHHIAPRDPNMILVFPSFAIVISSMLYGVLLAITRDWFDSSAILTGIWMGFLYYEAVHYRVNMSLTHSPILQEQRRGGSLLHFFNSDE